MTPAWVQAEQEMEQAGYSLNKIPRDLFLEHIWADGLLLFWSSHKRLPTAHELAFDMLDEWDDPVGTDESQEILNYLTKQV